MHTNTCEAQCGIFGCKPMNALEPVVCTVFFQKSSLPVICSRNMRPLKGLSDFKLILNDSETFRTFKRPPFQNKNKSERDLFWKHGTYHWLQQNAHWVKNEYGNTGCAQSWFPSTKISHCDSKLPSHDNGMELVTFIVEISVVKFKFPHLKVNFQDSGFRKRKVLILIIFSTLH